MSTKTSTSEHILQMAVYALIVLAFFVAPPVGTITPAGMRVFGIFIAFIVGFTITSDAWPGLATLFLFPFTGLVDFAGSLGMSFGTDVFFFVSLSLVLVAYLETTGAAAFVATWLLNRSFIKGHPWRLMAMILFICWLISSFVNAIAGMMLTWAFVYEIFAQFDYKPFDKLPNLLMLGTCVVGGLGLSTLPWGNNSIVILNAFTNATGLNVDYFTYIGFSVPYALLTILIYVLMCRYVFKLDVSRLKHFDASKLSQESQTMTPEKAAALIAMVALIAFILLPNCLPSDSAIVAFSNKIGLSGKLLFIFAALQIIRINGKPACNFGAMAQKGIPWKLLIVAADILILSGLLANQDTGISSFLAKSIGPVFQDKPIALFLVIVTVITVLCTNFMVNKIVAVLMISMTMPIIQEFGWDPIQFTCLYTVVSTVAFLLPSASQSSVILFSNTDWVRPGDVYKYGIPVIIVMSAMMIVWNILYFSVL